MNAQQLKTLIAQTINQVIRTNSENKVQMITEIFPKQLAEMLMIPEIQAKNYVFQVAKEIEGAL